MKRPPGNADNFRKVLFRLEPDEDGYPPVTFESVWGQQNADGTLTLDNIPFFTREATLGDVVEVDYVDGETYYRCTRKRSRNSLLRVVLFDRAEVPHLREQLQARGCASEWSEHHSLISVNVPPEADYAEVTRLLTEGYEAGLLDYEESILRH